MTLRNPNIALFISLLRSFNERHFVAPPHDLSPVRLLIFSKSLVVLQIFTNPEYNCVCSNAWNLCIFPLVPFAAPIMECSHRAGDINDRTLLCVSVFLFDSSELSIFIARHQMNSALWKLEQQEAWSHRLTLKVCQLRSIDVSAHESQE